MAETTGLEIQKLPANPVEGDVKVNAAFDLIDAATQQHLAINFASDADLTLSTSGTIAQWQYGVIELTDTGTALTTGRNVIVPDNERIYRIVNNTAQTLTIKTSAGTGIELTTLTGGLLYCDGTNVEDAIPGSGGGITDIAQDTTPQLGGNLDVNGNSIVSVSNGNIPITPNGTGSVILDGLNWPQADGTNGQAITTNGAGQLAFTTISGSGAVDSVNGETGTVVLTLDDIDDVNVTSPTDEYVLTYDSGTSTWIAAAAPSGSGASTSAVNNWTAGQSGEVTALTDGASIASNFSDSNFFSVTLGGNRTLSNPTNVVAGQSGSYFITQDGTGSRTLAYGSNWKFAGGTAPTLSTTASAVDRLDYVAKSSTEIHAVLTLAVA